MTLSKALAQIREVILTKWPGAQILVTNAPPPPAGSPKPVGPSTNHKHQMLIKIKMLKMIKMCGLPSGGP